jgi:diguanylate cyclase (GGDEF)-like protein/PAS domain S-box-containing protein
LEDLARRLLVVLGRLSGLETTYLTRIDRDGDRQHILYARNTGQLEVPEGLSVPWQDTLCRRVLDGGPSYTTDVPRVYPDSDAARDLKLRTYVSVPIEAPGGDIWGTLCGASGEQVELSDDVRAMMGILAEMVAGELKRDAAYHRLVEANTRLEIAYDELAASEQIHRHQREFLSVVLGSMHEGYVYTVENEIVDVNERFCRLTGFARDELIGQRHPFPFWAPGDVTRFSDAADILRHSGGDIEVNLMSRDGRAIPVAATVRPAFNPDGSAEGTITIVNDLSAVKRRERHLLDIAARDPLTGLFNRRAIDEHFALLQPGDAVVVLDLDHFKTINDTHGHAAGDHLLIALAGCLIATLRENDWAGRLGGEEFIVVVRDGGDDGAAAVTDRLRRAWDEAEPLTTFSAGIAVHTSDAEARQTLARADEAMYRAKRNGRNRTEVFSFG